MIDYVKIEINSQSVAEAIRKNQLFRRKNESDDNTGELEIQKGIYKGLKFWVLKNNKTIIEGSIHKYHNAGLHNHNDFRFDEVVKTINDISSTFDFEPKTATLHGLEFGVNVRIGQNPSTVLNTIVCYGNDGVNKMIIQGKRSDGIVSHQTNHIVKIYNKSLQYDQPEHILRVEEKIIRMRKIEHLEIKTLHDLCNQTKIASLGTVLFEMFDNLIIHEPIRLSELSKPELKLYEQAGNPRFWEDLNYSQRHKKRVRFEAIIQKYSTDQIKETIKKKVAEKWNELLKSGDVCTSDLKTKKAINTPLSIEGISNLSTSTNTKNILLKNFDKNEAEKRYCLSCGNDISHQRKDSVFCSEKVFGKIAKRCRNKDSNPRHNPKTNFISKVKDSNFKYHLTIPLFESEEVFKPSPQQQEMLIKVKFNHRKLF